jgi:Rps23 Pro-64 3,4-dihydroxylase Tpa1-like proline 4-hydroxylase
MEAVIQKELDLSSLETFSEPFQYFVSPKAFSPQISLQMLDWLESGAPWKLVETSFYEQYEFDFLDARIPDQISFLLEPNYLNCLRSNIENVFDMRLGAQIDLTAHKLLPGQRIRIHNDFIPGQETHRLLIQLNRNWRDEDGGFLLFFNSANPADIHKVCRPTHNSLVGFAITPNSHHAVSTIHGSERFTLVYSFYADK